MEPKLITSMSLHAMGAPVLAFLVALVVASSMPSVIAAGPVTAKSVKYNAQTREWQREGRICAGMIDDESQPLDWRSRYPWAEFVADSGLYRKEHACFLCLQVRNAEADNQTPVIVRIVDISDTAAGDQPIMMDEAAFSQIDPAGVAVDGLLQVNYEVMAPCPGD